MSLFGPAAIPRAMGHLTPETVNTGISAYPSDSQELSQKCVRLNVESFGGVPAPTPWPPSPNEAGRGVGVVYPPTRPLDMGFIAPFRRPRGTKGRITAKTRRRKEAEF